MALGYFHSGSTDQAENLVDLILIVRLFLISYNQETPTSLCSYQLKLSILCQKKSSDQHVRNGLSPCHDLTKQQQSLGK